MRWPFMLTSTHDAMIAAKDIEVATQQRYASALAVTRDEWCAAYTALRATHDTFVARMAEHTLPQPKAIPAAPAVRPRDEADEAIDRATLFNRDPRLRRHLEQFVRSRRAEGVASGEIAQAILHPPASDAGEYEPPA